MKRFILWALCGVLVSVGGRVDAQQVDKCATHQILQQNLNNNPELKTIYQHKRQQMLQQAAAMEPALGASGLIKAKTTANVTIPVVFHVILTQAQLDYLGGVEGVRGRMQTQLEVLNADFGGTNADSTQIPGPFKPLFAKSQIRFAPAHRTPSNTGTEGFEIRITTQPHFSAFNTNNNNIKSTAGGGLDAWDPDKYLNIWVVNMSEGGVLGFAVPPSFVGGGISKNEIGVVLRYSVFGRRTSVSQAFYPSSNDRGRTATHEVGHFFELEHTFGQNSSCPGAGDYDDGISDTPPQAGETYSSGGNCPPFPKTDVCSPTGNGVMWMNFMDYVDDGCMHLFTKGQSNLMMAQVAPGGLSHSLTQHPEVLSWPTDVAALEKEKHVSIFPNPSAGQFQLSFGDATGLESVQVTNMMGQAVKVISTPNDRISNYDIDLTGMAPGVYLIRCTFDAGTITKKIVLQ